MKTSALGRADIRQREGCRLVAYRDTRGIWTIGVGHAATGLPPRPFAGMTITEVQADQLLAADLAPVEAAINGAVKVPLTQNEFDALASLGFNIGVGGLGRSTIVGRLNRGDRAGAAQAFLLWAHPPELMGRRRAEMKQFQTPDAEPAPAPAAAPPAAPVAPAATPVKPVTVAPPPPAGILSRIASLFVG
jgi:lysozyme